MKNLLAQLPENHYNVLKLLLSYLLVISSNHEVNKMTLDNCGISWFFFLFLCACSSSNFLCSIVFGPVLFRPVVFDTSYILNVPRQSQTVEFLLQHFDELMNEGPTEEKIIQNAEVQYASPEDSPREDSEEIEIADDEFDKMKEEQMPQFLDTSSRPKSDIPHKWKQDKVHIATWCAGCQKIIAPKSRKKPVKLKVCEACDIPVHVKCTSKVLSGCEQNGKRETESDSLQVGQEAPDIPNVATTEDGQPISLYNILDEGKKVVVFFYPKCKCTQDIRTRINFAQLLRLCVPCRTNASETIMNTFIILIVK